MNPTMQTSDFRPARRLAGGAADASEPVHETLDALCAQLWGVDAAGLRAIQSAYRDLYVTAPREAGESADALREDAPEYRAETDGQEATS
jgi:hypothetical protein